MLTRMKYKPVWKLRLFQDVRYTELISSWQRTMLAVAGRRVSFVRTLGGIELASHWKHWICLFPQHGPGPKHLRAIRLEAWQKSLVGQFPHEFIKGLIESDGCRITNHTTVRGKRYEYPRYMFSNRSLEIQELFKWGCDLIGVEHRQANAWNVSVARKRSVAMLDEFIGPKR